MIEITIKENVSSIILNEGIDIIEDEVTNILVNSVKNKKVQGIETESRGKITCGSIILTTGTFLSGKIFMGQECMERGKNWRLLFKKTFKIF